MSFLRRLLAGCLFRHGHRLSVRERGTLHHVCGECGQDFGAILQAEIIRGPAHTPVPDLGAVTTKAKTVTSGKVLEFDQGA